jgi:NADH-quinone oxidoreductase subunit D
MTESTTEAPAPVVESMHGAPVTRSRGQVVLHVDRDSLRKVVAALAKDGFDQLIDVTAVDYSTADQSRTLPDGVAAERFEVVVGLLCHEQRSRVRLRVQVPAADPRVPSLFDLHPGSEALERETFDMFGIVFDDHPDLSRILMPEEWIGHPLRKDYAIGRIPVQFKTMSATHINETDERVRRREASAVLRMSEAAIADLAGNPSDPSDDERMIMNMGPSHPSTHGVLRLLLELEGETVMRSKPIIGYLHTGMEKTAEHLSFLQGPTNVTRMDYSAPLFNELVFSLAVEALLEIEVPERATWIRMMMCELNRMSSHLLFMATNGMDLGAVGMMIYGWREREEVLRFFEKVTGLRMNHNYIRPGGVAADLHDGWQEDVATLLDTLPDRLDEYDVLMSGQPIWRDRLQGVGVINTAEALALGTTGPILRSTGHSWDLRRDMPYLAYDQVDFDVIVGSYGDSYDRYAIRLNEIRESMRIVRQCLERMPKGDTRIQDKKVTPPPRGRIDESMEALIHHFKIFTEGFKVPEGEVYVAVESPRGELGCYLVSDGGAHPYRMHIRGPSFVNLQTLPYLMQGGVLADGVAVISSVDPIMGEVDR